MRLLQNKTIFSDLLPGIKTTYHGSGTLKLTMNTFCDLQTLFRVLAISSIVEKGVGSAIVNPCTYTLLPEVVLLQEHQKNNVLFLVNARVDFFVARRHFNILNFFRGKGKNTRI